MDEIEDMAAECALKPERLRVYFAELIRLREFANFAGRYRNRLPIKLQQAFERSVPAKPDMSLLVDEAIEARIENELHDPRSTNHEPRIL